jgi:hypothetical protein
VWVRNGLGSAGTRRLDKSDGAGAFEIMSLRRDRAEIRARQTLHSSEATDGLLAPIATADKALEKYSSAPIHSVAWMRSRGTANTGSTSDALARPRWSIDCTEPSLSLLTERALDCVLGETNYASLHRDSRALLRRLEAMC